VPVNPFGPATLGPVQLRNRVLKAATFEGMSPDSTVSGSLIDFHRRFAAGGVAMTTVSYVAVSRDGRGAQMLAAAGFDAVELHFGHHYLVSAFLSPSLRALQQVHPQHLLRHALRSRSPGAAHRDRASMRNRCE
jgi:2,4-dienoyl-CoA reductase-like NADH-dependent reductase (Old Yellow Enzyme family)